MWNSETEILIPSGCVNSLLEVSSTQTLQLLQDFDVIKMEHKATLRIFDSCWLEPRLHPKTTRNKIKDASQKFRTLKPIVGRFPTAPNLKLYIGPAEVSRLSI